MRKLRGGDARRLVPHQIVALQVEQLRVVASASPRQCSNAAPLWMPSGIGCRKRRRSARRPPARPGGATCVRASRCRGSACGCAAKNGARVSNSPSTSAWRMKISRDSHRIDRAVMHAPVAVEQQCRTAWRARTPPPARALLLPMRLVPVALDQMRAYALQPLRFDARDAAREQARGLDQFRRHDPAARPSSPTPEPGRIRNLMPRAPR